MNTIRTGKHRPMSFALLIAAVIGISVLAIYWAQSPRQTEISSYDDQKLASDNQSGANSDLDFADRTAQSITDSLSKSEIRPATLPTVFGLVDEQTRNRLNPWLTDVYLPYAKFGDAYIHTNFAAIDTQELRMILTESLKDRLDQPAVGETLGQLPSDFLMNLSEDATYRSYTTRGSEGSTGYTNFKIDLIANDPKSRAAIRLEFSPDGQVFGSGHVDGNYYDIISTPDPGVLAITQLDAQVVNSSFKID